MLANMAVINDSHKIKDLLTRVVEDVIVKEHLEQVLRSSRKLRVKFGIDPTGFPLIRYRWQIRF